MLPVVRIMTLKGYGYYRHFSIYTTHPNTKGLLMKKLLQQSLLNSQTLSIVPQTILNSETLLFVPQ